jgi:hypothetical protein
VQGVHVEKYIARANIDHSLTILNAVVILRPDLKDTLTKRLIAEQDKLAHDLEQLEFAESRAARGRQRLNQVRQLRDGADGIHRDLAERLVANVELTQDLLDGFCQSLREKVKSHGS